MRNEVSHTEQKLACKTATFKLQNEKDSVLRIFVIFFHPSTSVTAVGGAEKRFVETLKFFCQRKNVKMTVLESAPSLLAGPEINCERHLLSSSFHGKGWVTTYIEWIFFTVKASIRGIILACRSKTNAILAPNNTLPNLFSGYLTSLVARSPLFVIVHHIDIPFRKAGESNGYSLYSCYRSMKYGKIVSLAKAVAFYITLSLLKKARRIIAVSNFTAETLRNSSIPNGKIFVSGNAVDVNFINHVKPDTNRRIYDGIFVGRIAKEKGIFDLLTVWKEVVKVRKEAKLLIIGSGLEISSVKEKRTALGLTKRVFLGGHCSDGELYGLLKSSKVFIFPSVFEGWGIAVAEALACGLPVVAYDIPALKEVFGKCKSVFLVPIKDTKSMTATALHILNRNEKEFSELSYCSKIYSDRFDWEKVAQKDLESLIVFEER